MAHTRMGELDQVIEKLYLSLGRSVDDLLCDPDAAREFADAANAELGESLPASEILRRLMALRKLGEERGGLPRTQRNGGAPRNLPR
jgi:hypothetical protein